jgi:hypothetical protein
VNASAGLDLFRNDSLQLLAVYGDGVGGMGTTPASSTATRPSMPNGDLEALNYWSLMAGYTHRWNKSFRSTATYGYVNLDNASGQVDTFINTSHYASLNLVCRCAAA